MWYENQKPNKALGNRLYLYLRMLSMLARVCTCNKYYVDERKGPLLKKTFWAQQAFSPSRAQIASSRSPPSFPAESCACLNPFAPESYLQ